ncbi:MAG: hypothetical protein ACYDER_00005 [Ktedonobacteraceae bacterium]
MPATIFASAPLVAQMTMELRAAAAELRTRYHRSAKIARLVAGYDAAAEVYSRQLMRSCRSIGLDCVHLHMRYHWQTL